MGKGGTCSGAVWVSEVPVALMLVWMVGCDDVKQYHSRYRITVGLHIPTEEEFWIVVVYADQVSEK